MPKSDYLQQSYSGEPQRDSEVSGPGSNYTKFG